MSGDSFSDSRGLIIHNHVTNDAEPFDFERFKLSNDLLDRMDKWLLKISKYHPMNFQELAPHQNEIQRLDNEAIEFIDEIAKQLRNKVQCRLQYFSLTSSKVLHEIDLTISNG